MDFLIFSLVRLTNFLKKCFFVIISNDYFIILLVKGKQIFGKLQEFLPHKSFS